MSNPSLNNPPLRVFVAPISGGALVCQIALMKEISMARGCFDTNPCNLAPHICMGSSGGNIANYISLAAGWNPYAFNRITSLLDADMLTKSWWPQHLDFLPTSLIGIFSGSLYRQGYGACKLFHNIFTPKIITSVEVWTGVFNKTKGKAQMFCNKREGETYVTHVRFERDRDLFNCEPLTYTNGNIELIAKISVASASIPVLISEQTIYGSHYVDGGIMYASPLTVMTGELFRIISGDQKDVKDIPQVIVVEDQVEVDYTKGECEDETNVTEVLDAPVIGKYKLQLIYFSCSDINGMSPVANGTSSVMGGAGTSITTLIDSLSIIDRAKGVDLMRTLAGKEDTLKYKHYPALDTIKLGAILAEAQNYQHYYLNLYPHGAPGINMLNFNTEDIHRVMDEVACAYGGQIWYIG